MYQRLLIQDKKENFIQIKRISHLLSISQCIQTKVRRQKHGKRHCTQCAWVCCASKQKVSKTDSVVALFSPLLYSLIFFLTVCNIFFLSLWYTNNGGRVLCGSGAVTGSSYWLCVSSWYLWFFFLTCFSSLVNKQLVNLCILQFFQALFPMLQLKTFLIDFLFQPLSSIYYFLYSVLSALSTWVFGLQVTIHSVSIAHWMCVAELETV